MTALRADKETVETHTHTPVRWIECRRAQETPVLLEDRLKDFVAWLQEKGVILWDTRVLDAEESDGFLANSLQLIEEYVNT